MNDFLSFLSATTYEVLRGSDEDIRRETTAAAEQAKHPQTVGLMDGLRAHVVLQVFRQQGVTGFEDHFSQFLEAIKARKATIKERKGLRPARSQSRGR